jgi:hypothetical protein
MERPHAPPKENKLLLLYTFHKVGAMTNLQVMRFVIDNGLMDYLDLQLSLAELTDSGLLQVLPVDDSRYYTLTFGAQETLRFFTKQIPASRRELIDGTAQEWRALFQRERLLTADYLKDADGGYTVHLAAREAGTVLVDIKLGVPALAQAKKLCAAWDNRAADAYRALIQTLLSDAPQEAPREVPGADPHELRR